MEFSWFPPEQGFMKINIHYVPSAIQDQERNLNGIGVIVRIIQGQKIWAALGPLNAMREQKALMWESKQG